MFSSNIKELMKKKSVTMERLSAETGLSTRTIDRARGKLISECKLSTLAKIGAALGVKTKKLYEEVPDEILTNNQPATGGITHGTDRGC